MLKRFSFNLSIARHKSIKVQDVWNRKLGRLLPHLSSLLITLAIAVPQTLQGANESVIKPAKNPDLLVETRIVERGQVDKWGHPAGVSSGAVEASIELAGAESVVAIQPGELELFIIPDNSMQERSSPGSVYVSDLLFYLSSPEGELNLTDGMYYEFLIDGTWHRREEINDLLKSIMGFSADVLPALLSLVPYLGPTIGVLQAVVATKQWADATEPDWEAIWKVKSNFDVYPLPMPPLTFSQSCPRAVKIHIPINANANPSKWVLRLERLVLRPFQGGSDRYHTFPEESWEIDFGRQPTLKTAAIVPSPVLNYEEKVTPLEMGLFGNFKLKLKAEFEGRASASDHILRVDVEPIVEGTVASDHTFELLDIAFALEIPKGEGGILGFPRFYDGSGQQLVKPESQKYAQGMDALRSWLGVAVDAGLKRLDKVTKTKYGKAVSLGKVFVAAGNGLGAFGEQDTFEKNLSLVWSYENQYDRYQLPKYNLNSSSRGSIEIPFEFYTPKPSVLTLYFTGTVREWIKPSGMITSASVTDNIVDFAYAVPLQCSPVLSPSVSSQSIVLIFDCSGSMSSRAEGDPSGRPKIEVAKEALKQVLSAAPASGVEWALITCQGNEPSTLLRFSTDNSSITGAITPIQAQGGTPLGRAILNAIDLIDRDGTSPAGQIVLLSDGMATDGNAAVEAAKSIKERNELLFKQLNPGQGGRTWGWMNIFLPSQAYAQGNTTPVQKMIALSAVAFGMEQTSFVKLKELVDLAGGNLYEANNAQSLFQTLAQATSKAEAQQILSPQAVVAVQTQSAGGGTTPPREIKGIHVALAIVLAAMILVLSATIIAKPAQRWIQARHQSRASIVDRGTNASTRLDSRVSSIGRSGECDLILNDPLVSAVHAKILSTKTGFELVDNASENGTWVNGTLVTRVRLRHGDHIRIGETELLFLEERPGHR